ncbi:angiopoietin-related protein 7-like [Drosophila kikkawai]|uniref:Angiopoietin-related protein 7-like n=1 Tax=Drosophila kikkawai TaxID=30033 RepID=A0ABM4GE94_DROKI
MTDIIQNMQNQLDKNIQTHNEELIHKYNIIHELTYEIQDKNHTILNMTKTINSLRSQLVNAETQIKEQDIEINQKQQNIMKFGEQLRNAYEKDRQQSKQLKEQNEQLMNKTEQLKQKDSLLETKNNEIKTQNENIKNNKIKITSLNKQIGSIEVELSQKRDHLLIYSAFQRCPKNLSNAISTIKLPGVEAFEAPCNSTGWMTIQKRFNFSESFNRTWNSYKQGFGDIRGEFFLGLEKLHQMTKAQPHELLIQLKDPYGKIAYAHYNKFQIGSEKESYYLKSLGNFTGNTKNALSYNLGMKFTTYDRDNDMQVNNCAKILLGGWWFNECGQSLPNRNFNFSISYALDSIFWPIFVGDKWRNYMSDIDAEIMIKPKNY